VNITVLDGYTLNAGDLSWEEMATLGHLTVYDRTPASLTINRALDSEIVITNKTVLDADTIAALPRLSYIGVLATGYNVVDIRAAAERGIVVTNIPSYSTQSVAQMAMALLLAITERVEHYTEENRQGKWSSSPDFCYTDTPLHELAGKQMGVVGFGHTGSATAAVAAALGMKIAVSTSRPQEALPEGYVKMGLDELFSTSDVVSLHCPLTPDTHNLVNASRLKTMKPTAILLNTSRGSVVNEADLAEALHKGTIYAAGIDVMCSEPPEADNPLLSAPRCFITPHIAWATAEARRRLMEIATANVRAFIEGHPQNRVN